MPLADPLSNSSTLDVIPFKGWEHNARLSNGIVELVVSLDVGPRVLSYRLLDGESVFHVVPEHQGGTGESTWRSRGGHRFWLAPESAELSYYPDNGAVEYEAEPATGEVVFTMVQEHPQPLRKSLRIALEETTSQVHVRHVVENLGQSPISLSTWALSVMKPGGCALLPQPPHGEHPRDLLPDRNIVLWPYTDLTDDRYFLGRDCWTLRQRTDRLPTKLGLRQEEGWAAYRLGSTLFMKSVEYAPDATYPDGGCNLEVFTNAKMLELETLGPLVRLAPGETTGHGETWDLVDVDDCSETKGENAWLSSSLHAGSSFADNFREL